MGFCIKAGNNTYKLKLGINIIGRQRGGDIQIMDPHISRRHLSIDLADGTMTFMDLGSSNGLYINGQKVSNAVLNIGDNFTIGTTSLTIEET